MKTITIVLITAITLVASCCTDEDGKPQNRSRTLRYELTGNFSGSNILAAYTTASGGATTEEINSLPWNKEITFDANVAGATITVSGAGGGPGQQVTLIIKKGGTQVGSPDLATVDSGGTFTISAPAIIF